MAINLNDIKKMPPKAKLGIILVAFSLVGYLYWFYFLQNALDQKTSLNDKLTTMQEKISGKQKIADQIKKYMADVAVLKDNYKTALQKLPDQREIPTLFHSISAAGMDAGVDFLLFEPKASVPKMLDTSSGRNVSVSAKTPDKSKKELPPEIAKIVESKNKKGSSSTPKSQEPFYEEIPVAVSITGTYQNMLFFFDKVAKLPRIVNVSDITMNKVDAKSAAKGKQNLVTSNCTIKTYMFIEKKEKPVEKPGEKPGEKPNEKK